MKRGSQRKKIALWLALLGGPGVLLFLVGCGGGAKTSIITGIRVSPSATVNPGDQVTLTATVTDSTQVRTATWRASGGTMAVSRGLTGVWVAPAELEEPAGFAITLEVFMNDGRKDQETVHIQVIAPDVSLSGARIINLTSSASIVGPGQEVSLQVSVANSSETARVSWSASAGHLVSEEGFQVKWIAPTQVEQDLPVTITVTTVGQKREVFSASLNLLVSAAGFPLITGFRVGTGTGSAVVNPGDTVPLTVEVQNAAEVATVHWSASSGIMAVAEGTQATWIAPTNVTQDTIAVITVEVTNNRGLKNQGKIQILVRPTGR